MREFSSTIAGTLRLRVQQVETVIDLLEEGSTIPFIARYRKDKTDNLDEVVIQQIQDQAKFLKEFTERKTFIEKTITEQGKMTDALQAKLDMAATINELEDIYLPYKPKRKTKAQTARENGLEPLALLLLEQKDIVVVRRQHCLQGVITYIHGTYTGRQGSSGTTANDNIVVHYFSSIPSRCSI